MPSPSPSATSVPSKLLRVYATSPPAPSPWHRICNIEPLSSTLASATSFSLNLHTVIDGVAVSNAFPIDISFAQTVGHLKKLIKTEMSPEFDDITAEKLTLWQVAIPTTKNDEEGPISLETMSEKSKLLPTARLSKLYINCPAEDTIHILVQRPPSAAALQLKVRVLTYPNLPIRWTTNANTATRSSLLAAIFEVFPALESIDCKLTVYYTIQEDHSSQQCVEVLEDDKKLQDILLYNHRHNICDLNLMVSHGNKAFNQIDWNDLPKLWGIKDYPSFGTIGQADLDFCEKEWNVLKEQLSGFVQGDIRLKNERESSAYVLSFLARARMLYPELSLDCETPLNGSFGHGKADMGVHALGIDSVKLTVGITEVKVAKCLQTGLAQNGAQLEATNITSATSAVISYGIVTDAKV
ncbi:hypothetical protein BGZ70_002210, partial [Mortierella alpina]